MSVYKNLPEPSKSLLKFLTEAKKAEQATGQTVGAICFGYSIHKGVETLTGVAQLADKFVHEAYKCFEDFDNA